MGVLSDPLYPRAHTAYLLPWGFLFGDAIVLYAGVFLLPRTILLSSVYHIILLFPVPLAVPYLVAPEFLGPVAPLLSLVAYAARAS